MAIKIKFLGRQGERFNYGKYGFNPANPDSLIKEGVDEAAEFLVKNMPDYFEVHGVKKVEPKVEPKVVKEVKSESYATKDVKSSEATKSDPAPKKTVSKKKGKK